MNNDMTNKNRVLWDHKLCKNNLSTHKRLILVAFREIVNFNPKRECKIDNIRKSLLELFIVE